MNDLNGIYEGIMSGEVFSSLEAFEAFLSTTPFQLALVIATPLILMAIYSFRLFKTTISSTMFVSCGIVGYTIADLLPIPTVEGFNISAIIGILFACIGFILGFKLYKLSLFVSCAVSSYFGYIILFEVLSAILPPELVAINVNGILIAPAILGVLTGILALLIFKPMYIISTSLSFMSLAVALIVVTIAPCIATFIIGAVLGLILGIPAAKHQFACDEK